MSKESTDFGTFIGRAWKAAMGGRGGGRRGRGGGRGGHNGGVKRSGGNCYNCNSPYHQRKDCPTRDRPRHGRASRQEALPAAPPVAALPAPATTATPAAPVPAATLAAPALAPTLVPAPPLSLAPSELSEVIFPLDPVEFEAEGLDTPMSDLPAVPQANEGSAAVVQDPEQLEAARLMVIQAVSRATTLSGDVCREILTSNNGDVNVSIDRGIMLATVSRVTGMTLEASEALLRATAWVLGDAETVIAQWFPDGNIPDNLLRADVIAARRERDATMAEPR
ncbi:hypothetical protein ACJA88_002873 [Fusarium oxysporum]